MFTLLGRRLRLAFGTVPTRRDWLETVVCLVNFGLVAVPFGMATGFLQLTGPEDSLVILLAYTAVALVFPGIAEELVFRCLLLPHPSERRGLGHVLLAATVALVLFVLWHPLNAWLFLPWTRPLFYRGDFLVVATLLGIGATYLYLRTGSIWPGVAFHWAIDVAWKLAFGGRVITFGPPA